MTDEKPSVTLQHYIEKLLCEREKRLNERFEAQEKALKLAVSQSHWMVATAISAAALIVALIALFWKK